MKFKEEIIDDVAVVYLKGNLMGGDETQVIKEHVNSLLSDDVKKVVMDLSKVKWINSSGLGVLMAAMTSLRNSGGNLKLASVAEKVQSILMITQLIKIFETYESVDRAIASYKTDNK